ncbi:hypothetical protein MKW98_007222 [Papaver atlanticum]|uniref:LysM domain-containing protein n=1 Tax=Papaver atlanticum TaxID=357466 RepID=A0AAD4XH12_9MAGN|nr:hypothetical protein MKW98_007222 [Papaver atlanticum]
MTLFNKFIFFILLLFVFTCSSRAGFTCKTTKTSTCKSLAGYVSPNATTLSDIAARFGLLMDFDSLLGANSLPLDTPPDKVVDAKETIIIPFTCTCNNGTGVSDKSPVYKVLPGDFLYHIATDIFGLLITTDEIAAVNNISNPELIEVDQLLWIPIPCSCDNVDGNQVVHYAYVVPPSRSLDMVAKKFGVTVESLSKLNEISDGEELEAEVVLDVPLRACTSTVGDASPDYPLLASNGSYIFTANNCVKCTCNSNNKNWTLHCEPSPPDVKVQNWKQCPLVQCPGGRGTASNYALGQLSYLDNSTCNGTNCAYTGYNNLSGTISASLLNVNTCLGE